MPTIRNPDNKKNVVNEESRKHVYVTRRYAVYQSQEPAVMIGMRDYDRLIERLDRCKPCGWADLWLSVAGAGAALGVGALVGALTLPRTTSGAAVGLWVIMAAGTVIFGLCVFFYLTQRRNQGKEIAELEKDLEIRK